MPAIFERLQVNYSGLICESKDTLLGMAAELAASKRLVRPMVSKDDWDNLPYCGFE